MGMSDYVYSMLQSIAKASLDSSKENDGDFRDDSGILFCGVCGEAKEAFIEVEGREHIKRGRMCKCVRDAEAERKENEKKHDREKHIEAMKRVSGIHGTLETLNFNSLENEENEKSISRCKKYAQKFTDMYKHGQGLLLWGSVGTGKTWSAACIGNEVLNQERSVFMIPAMDIVDREEPIPDVSLLIIDDLGAERNTSFAKEKVLSVLNKRVMSGKPMIITTNKTPMEMGNEDDMDYRRMYDRVLQVCAPIQFAGQTLRKIDARKRYNELMRELDGD